jgi:hypothetical protein
VDFCVYGTDPVGSTKGGKILYQLRLRVFVPQAGLSPLGTSATNWPIGPAPMMMTVMMIMMMMNVEQ